MDDIKVSVCMVTYNHERYIAQAVDSVLAQQRDFSLELVIGEDFSTDRTREIVQELARRNPDQIRLRLSERNEGGKANFLATIAECRGKYVAMLEGDDYWTNANKLQLQIDALDSHPEWAICFHPSACLYEDGLQGVPVYPFGWIKPVATVDDLFKSNFMATSSVVFRNRLFPEFPSWFRELVIGDWPLHILNAAHGDIGFLPEVMSAYRIHGAGVWSGAAPAEQLVMIFEAFNAIDHHFGGKYTQSINKYRADTIRYVMSQLDAANHQAAAVVDRLRSTQSQTESQTRALALSQAQESVRSERLEIDLLSVRKQYSALEKNYAVLWENTQRLQAFYDVWSKSIAYRVEREIRRPFRRLRRYWQNRRNSGSSAPPSSPVTSKAA